MTRRNAIRSKAVAEAHEIVKQAPKDYLLDKFSDPVFMDLYFSGVQAHMQRPRPRVQVLRMVGEIYGLLAKSDPVIEAKIVAFFGMDPDTAKRYVERGRDADQVADDPETVRDAAVRALKSLFERFPEWRANVLLALGSGAEEA